MEFNKDLFENFWIGKGDIILNRERFADIVSEAENSLGANETKGNQITLANDQPGISKVVNFYSSPEYSLAFGRATLYYDIGGNAVGFSDYYNFDPKPEGVRSKDAEKKIRMVNFAAELARRFRKGRPPKAFNISYGIEPKQK